MRILCAAVLAGAFFSTYATAQLGATAELSGLLLDPAGLAVPTQPIALQRRETGQTWTAITSGKGTYRFTNLAPGRYQIATTAGVFAALRVSVILTVAQRAVLDLHLSLAEIREGTTISAEAQVAEPTRTDLSEVIDSKRINDLPINGRQFLDFALLTPNVHKGRSNVANPSTPGEPNQVDLSFAGLHESTTLVMVDGANDMNRLFGRARSTPSQEAALEFRVLNDTYSAEFGPATAGVVSIVTKSGTTDLHGSLYEYFRNNALDARNILAPPGFDELRQNQFGATLGGPIVRNLFYFLNYEGQRRTESPFYSSILLNNLAAINRAKQSFGLSPEVLNGVFRSTDYDTSLGRVDYQVSARSVFGINYRFHEDRDTNLPAATNQLSAPSNFRNAKIDDHAGTVNWSYTFSPTLINQALLQFANRDFNFPSVTDQPHLQIANTLDLGRHFNAIDGYSEFRFEMSDAVTWVKGGHTFRFGGEVSPVLEHFYYDPFDPAYIVFPNLNAFVGLPPFNAPFVVTFGFSETPNGSRPSAPVGFAGPADVPAFNSYVHQSSSLTSVGFFAQDQWKVSPKLTLNYGLRWDANLMPKLAFDRYYKSFQPRAGIAYRLNERITLRAGAGEFQGQAYSLVYLIAMVAGQDSQFGLPQGNTYAVFNDVLHNPFYSNPALATAAALQFLHTGSYPVLNPANFSPAQEFVSTVKRYNHGGPYSYQWNAQVDVKLSRDLVLSISYLGVRGLELPSAYGGNVAPTTLTLPDGRADYAISPTLAVAKTIDPLISPLSLFFDASGQSSYNSGTAALVYRFSNRYSLTANYTWSHTIDDSADPSLNGYPQDPYRRYLERANSKQDIRQRLVTTWLAQGPLHGIMRDFRVALIGTAQSPSFYTIYAGQDINHDGNANTDRVGLLGRNTYRGDRDVDFDVRLSRTLHLWEKVHAEAIAEAFNIANTLNVTDINTVYGAGTLTGALPTHFGQSVASPLASFGSIRATDPPRQIQFALRLQF
jgi:Carboxypeptidase regulatory-like domain/TonB dependent receptor